MHLSPKDMEKLMLHQAGFLAQKRYARGISLNYAESIALISSQILEFIREGNSVAQLMSMGKKLLGLKDVMDKVDTMIHEVQVEGTFPDGTKLVTIHQPICNDSGDPKLALHGSGLKRAHGVTKVEKREFSPGEYCLQNTGIQINEGRISLLLKVINKGDRPVQVGSHYPFFETNPSLSFDRKKAYGKRLDIPSGTAIRFEPGESKTVGLIDIAGNRVQHGGNNLIDGSLSDKKESALENMMEKGFAHKEVDDD
ncbi:MAG: urease subunit gamma [Desulfobacteraceae bacterium]|nr:urease subunit gamma [Desulfobacteraceae bacterium]